MQPLWTTHWAAEPAECSLWADGAGRGQWQWRTVTKRMREAWEWRREKEVVGVVVMVGMGVMNVMVPERQAGRRPHASPSRSAVQQAPSLHGISSSVSSRSSKH